MSQPASSQHSGPRAASAERSAAGSASLPISVANLTKAYGTFRALDDVSLEVASGEFITLLGPSGSGKTTLLMVLAGFTRPDSGTVRFGGDDVTLAPPHKRGVGMVFQNYALFPHMTVAGNLAYPLKLRRVDRSEIEARVRKALDTVQLQGLGERQVDQLSGGQRQRVALARAIIFEPRILLMDEPLSALDKKLREEMQIEVRHLHQRLGMTTVYVTHDQREALTMSDRVAVIDKGRFRQIGKPRDIYERPATRFIAEFIGESSFLPVTLRDGRATIGDQVLRFDVQPVAMASPQLVLRPEKLRILAPGEDGAGLNLLRGRITELVYQGESTLIYVDLDGGPRIATRQAASAAAPPLPGIGGAITLGLAPADTFLVPGGA
ncbi:MAG: ABC transporter ATP-binding protein [Alphaproteobacteria bacterium]|nr:ABC transporter ATP-binding protein [Alphaproteobacteria bacterium]